MCPRNRIIQRLRYPNTYRDNPKPSNYIQSTSEAGKFRRDDHGTVLKLFPGRTLPHSTGYCVPEANRLLFCSSETRALHLTQKVQLFQHKRRHTVEVGDTRNPGKRCMVRTQWRHWLQDQGCEDPSPLYLVGWFAKSADLIAIIVGRQLPTFVGSNETHSQELSRPGKQTQGKGMRASYCSVNDDQHLSNTPDRLGCRKKKVPISHTSGRWIHALDNVMHSIAA